MKSFLLLALVISSFSVLANDAAEVPAVQKAVMDAYVNGTQKDNTKAMRAGFHDSFVMFVRTDEGEIRTVTRDGWIERIEKGKKKNPDRPVADVQATFPTIQVSGHAAVARVEVWRDGKYVFTDFLSLYKFDDGWKIVGKIFQSHK
jgi:hypothetical protein